MTPLDAQQRRRLLALMGVTVWSPRGEAAGSAGTPPAPGAEDAAGDAAVPAPGGPGPRPGREAEIMGLGWEALARAVAGCTACGLHATRTQTVFGVGAREAEWMIVGEAPGQNEDRQGEPFVGRAGRLLNAMLRAVGLGRERVFIANTLKCRPPGNRDPRPEETACCGPYLGRQIDLVAPRVILAVGRIAAQTLLESSAPLGRLRGRVHRPARVGVPVVVTYHPAYLLRSPQQKRAAWQDLKLARSVVEDAA